MKLHVCACKKRKYLSGCFVISVGMWLCRFSFNLPVPVKCVGMFVLLECVFGKIEVKFIVIKIID